jgi:hypothetical protein
MRIPVALFLLGFATAVSAQELDKDTQARVRAERSAGGVGKISPEEREGANLGAGPHKERHTAAARREPRETPADRASGRESARGNTR